MTISRKLIMETAVIAILASVLGLAWNRTMIYDSWSGRVSRESPAAAAGERLPLPLGIAQVKELFDRGEGIVLDARDRAAYSAGHIRGSRSFPLGETTALLPEFRKQVPRTMPIIIYCNGYGCPDSMELAKKLIQAGYWEIFVYEGGFPEWQEMGYPVERTSS